MSDFIVIHGIKVHKDYANFVPETFGRLTTIGPKFKCKNRHMQVCQCTCGKVGVYDTGNMRAGRTQSCGCLNRENIKTKTIRHGHTANGDWSPEYRSYVSMKQRCLDPNNNRYGNYALLGVTICSRWLEPNSSGFKNFLEDMGLKPDPRYTIERKDPKGNYCPENCCWLPGEDQHKNKRNTLYITALGKTQTVVAWAQELGVKAAALRARLRYGWTHHDCVTTPMRKQNR